MKIAAGLDLPLITWLVERLLATICSLLTATS